MGEKRVSNFDIHGLAVHLDAPERLAPLVEECERLWAFYLVPPGPPPQLTISLREPKEWAPLQALQRQDSPIVFGPLGWYYEGDCFILHEPNLVIVGMPGHIDCYVRNGYLPESRNFAHFTLNLAFIEALRSHGLFYVHAAALQGPNGKRYLINGDSGCGKSTFTTSLLMNGFRYLSDDAVFIDTRPIPARVLGYHKHFHVGNDLIQRFAQRAGSSAFVPYGETQKSEVDPERLFPEQRLRSFAGIDIILIPSILRGESASRIEALPQVEVLTQFFNTSTQVFFDKRLAVHHLKALRHIAGNARGYLFQAGQDVYQNPALYEKLIQDL